MTDYWTMSNTIQQSPSSAVAVALFDNEAEWPDELSFRKGDRLQVLRYGSNAGGEAEDGWLVCLDQAGNRGIAPANRLRLLQHQQPAPPRRTNSAGSSYHTMAQPVPFGDPFGYGSTAGVDNVGRAPYTFNGGVDDLFMGRMENPLFDSDDWMSPNRWPRQEPTNRFSDDWSSTLPVSSAGSSRGYSPVVRNVPIRLEGVVPNGKLIAGSSINPSDSRNILTPSLQRAPPPPPPKRRYFNLLAPTIRNVAGPAGGGRGELGGAGDDDARKVRPAAPDAGHETVSTSSATTHAYQGSAGDSSSAASCSSSLSDDSPSFSAAVPASSQQKLLQSPEREVQSNNGGSSTDSQKKSNGHSGGFYDKPRQQFAHSTTERQLTLTLDPVYDTPRVRPGKDGNVAITSVEHSGSTMQVAKKSVQFASQSPADDESDKSGSSKEVFKPEGVGDQVQTSLSELSRLATRLEGYASRMNWRHPSILHANLADINEVVRELVNKLEVFLEGLRGEPAYAAPFPDTLAGVGTLRRTKEMLTKSLVALDGAGWTLSSLSRAPSSSATANSSDSLDQVAALTRHLLADCRQALLSLAAANQQKGKSERSGRTFGRHLSNGYGGPANVPTKILEEDEQNDPDEVGLFADYAYVNADAKSNGCGGDKATENKDGGENGGLLLCAEERQIANFYADQVEDQLEVLSRAIERFLSVVEGGQQEQPRAFLQQSKLVILAAHKLVYMADSLVHCLQDQSAVDVRTLADRLCQLLRHSVQATKHAADNYPQVAAVRAMLDQMVAVSQTAYELKLLIRRLCSH